MLVDGPPPHWKRWKDPKPNWHWAPQADRCGDLFHPVFGHRGYTQLVPFEHIQEMFHQVLPGVDNIAAGAPGHITHANASALDSDSAARLRRFYARDLELYEEAKRDWAARHGK